MGGSVDLGRRGVLALGAAVVLSSCTPDSRSTDGGNDGNTDDSKVRTDLEPLERRFTALGPLSDAHWLGVVLGSGSRVSAPGPTDVRVVGLARLRAGGVAAVVGAPQRDFQPATPPQPPSALAQFMPKSARWVRSESFDNEMTTDSGAFYFDPGTDSVYFDTINPRPANTLQGSSNGSTSP
ncbi:hypothetical protein [Streptomyces sp. SA15]|uniref:hypothetical protein n=1 Tax=Streptomyces sp. SA15 TaxID=934019 RepID=UPI000BB08CA8|nr:hypothetical protein [Streptomyces sp. SA15]